MSITSTLSLNSKPFNKELKKAEKNMVASAKKMNKEIGKVGKKPTFSEKFKIKMGGLKDGLEAGGIQAEGLEKSNKALGGGVLAIGAAAAAVALKATGQALSYYQQKRKDAVAVEEGNYESLLKIIEIREEERAKIKQNLIELEKYSEKAVLSYEEQVKALLKIQKLEKNGIFSARIENDSLTIFDAFKEAERKKAAAQQLADLQAQEQALKNQIKSQNTLTKVDRWGVVSDAWLGTSYVKDAEDAAKKSNELVENLGKVQKKMRELKKNNSSKVLEQQVKDENAILESRLKDIQKQKKQTEKDSSQKNYTEDEKVKSLEKEIAEEKEKIAGLKKKTELDEKFLKDNSDAAGYKSYEEIKNATLKERIKLEERLEKIRAKEREVEEIKAKQTKNFKKHLEDQSKSLRLKALEILGLKKQAQIEKALEDAKKSKGSELTDSEKKSVTRLVELQRQLENIPKLEMGDLETKTNELTSRGGFKTGAVETSTDKINRQISIYSKMQAETASKILQEIQKLSGV